LTKDESAYLERVRDSIARIEKYTSGMDELAFMTDELVQDAVIRQLQIIGEAAKKLSDGTKDQGIIFRCSVERHHRKVLPHNVCKHGSS